jgi:hypothetical protein
MKERLPIEKSVFWSDLGVARKIYRNLAIIPRVQKGPSFQELNKRATKLIGRGRPSTVDFGDYTSEKTFAPPTRKSRFQIPRGSDEHMEVIRENQPTMDSIAEDIVGPSSSVSGDPKRGEDTV